MKKIYRFYILLAAAAVLSFASGCLNESSISPDTTPPSMNGRTDYVLPRVTSTPALTILNYSGTGPFAIDTPRTKRVVVNFSESMDVSTITTDSVYVRNVAAGPIVINGQTVRTDEQDNSAIIEWTDTTDYTLVPLEVVVESSAADLSGNQLAGVAAYFGNSYPYNETVSDYRAEVQGSAGNWTNTPEWRNLRVSMAITAHTATTVTVVATFYTNDAADITGLTVSNFLTSGGTVDAASYIFAGGPDPTSTFNITGLTENTEYTVTFNPEGVRINTGVVTRMYPDGATALGTLTGSDFIDTFGGTKGHRSSYVLPFMMYNNTATIPTLVSVSDQTSTVAPGIDPYTAPAICIGSRDFSSGWTFSGNDFDLYVDGAWGGDIYVYGTVNSAEEAANQLNWSIANYTSYEAIIHAEAFGNFIGLVVYSPHYFEVVECCGMLAEIGFTAGTYYSINEIDYRAIQIQFSAEPDASAFVAANYEVYDILGNPVGFTATQYYMTGDTALRRVLISTIDNLQQPIGEIVITNNVTCGGIQLDGNGNGALEGTGDYNQNGIPDDWVDLTDGTPFAW